MNQSQIFENAFGQFIPNHLSKYSITSTNWFRINTMVANFGKFQIMFLGSNSDSNKITFMIENKE